MADVRYIEPRFTALLH